MKPVVEIGRFIVTALAVALAIPTYGVLVSLFSGERFSFEAFLAIGTISFAMSLLGGLLVGLPTLWIAKRAGWSRDLHMLAPFSSLMGALGGMILSIGFWQGNLLIVMSGLIAWVLLGAIAGFVSACVWFWLHASDQRQLAND